MLKFRAFHTVLAVAMFTSLAGCQTTTEATGPIADVLFQTAATAEQNGDHAAAAQHYQKLNAKDPDNVTVLFALVRNLRYSGASAQAVKLLTDATSEVRSEPGYHLELGKAQLAAGNNGDAIASVEKALAADPKNWEAHSTLGIAHDLSDDFAKGQQSYRRALDLSPKNPTVLNNLAISLALSGDLAGAIATLKDAPRVARHNPQIRQNLALFYGIKGDVKKAKALGKIDLDEDAVAKNLEIYSQLRRQ